MRRNNLLRYVAGIVGVVATVNVQCDGLRRILDEVPVGVYCDILEDISKEPVICDYNPDGWRD